MNSKIFLFFILLSFVGCGVKARPVVPPEKAIPSYIKNYTSTEENPFAPPPAPEKK